MENPDVLPLGSNEKQSEEVLPPPDKPKRRSKSQLALVNGSRWSNVCCGNDFGTLLVYTTAPPSTHLTASVRNKVYDVPW